jgi:two-component system phosphate regulon response regulator PhoB
MKPLVLVVEDDPSLVELLRYNLEAEGFDVLVEMDGETGTLAIEERDPDLVILDWMLPKRSGIEVCRQVRRTAKAQLPPIIMLTARGEESDKIQGLDSGADDYIVKPFSPSELIARVRAVLRRSKPERSAEELRYMDITMDLAKHRVTRGEQSVKLGPTEFRMLRVFMEKPGRVFSREQLLNQVWGRDIFVEPRTVDVHIRRLRQALNLEGTQDVIRTVRAAGYALDTAAH